MTGSPSARNFAVTSMPASTTPVMIIISIAAGCAILEVCGLVIKLMQGICHIKISSSKYYSSNLSGAINYSLIRVNVKQDDYATNTEEQPGHLTVILQRVNSTSTIDDAVIVFSTVYKKGLP